MPSNNEIQILLNAMFKDKGFKDAQAALERLNRAQYQSLQARNALEQTAAQTRVRTAEAEIKQRILIQKALEDQQKRFNDIQRTFLGRLSTLGAKGGMEGAIKQSEEFRASLSALAQDAVVATGILVGFAAAIKTAYDFGKEGAQIDRLRESGTKLAQSYGTDMEEAVLRIKAASHGAITANAAVLESNRAMLLNVARDSETIAKLVEIASIRGRVAGLSAQEAFDRITLGIGRLSTRILDDIGIVVDGETAYANYGKAIGKVADDLTEAEKRQALANAIIEDGNELLKQTGGVTDDAANAYERFETHITDATNALKQNINEGVAPLIRTLDILLFGFMEINDAIKLHSIEVFQNAKEYEEYRSEMQRVADSQGLVINSSGDLVKVTHSRTGAVEELVQAEYLHSQAEFEMSRLTDDRREAIEQLNDILKYQEERERAVADAIRGLMDITGKAADLTFEDAAKSVLEFAEAAGVQGKALDKLKLEFGLADASVLKFRDALVAAAKDGVISLDELEEAFSPVKMEQAAQRTIELWEEVDQKIRDLRERFRQDVLDSERQLADDMEDAATKRDRDLADLEEENNRKRHEAIADAGEKRRRDEEDAESAHQRRIQKILDKYNRSRLQALIDLDARALFEAELTRDQELKDAEEDRKERKEQSEKELKDKIKDIEDNYEERRREILQQYDRDIEDAKEADRRRKRDLQRALDEQVAEQEKYRQEEMKNIEQFLADRWSKEQLDYQDRLNELIEYWQGVLQINELYGGLNSPTPTSDPDYNPPPGDVPVPGEELGDYNALTAGGGGIDQNSLVGGTGAGGGNGSNIVVTLNVTGDAVLASLIRSAAYNAIVDVVAD